MIRLRHFTYLRVLITIELEMMSYCVINKESTEGKIIRNNLLTDKITHQYYNRPKQFKIVLRKHVLQLFSD